MRSLIRSALPYLNRAVQLLESEGCSGCSCCSPQEPVGAEAEESEPTAADEDLNAYMVSIVDALQAEFVIEDESAWELMREVAEAFFFENVLPPFPRPTDSEATKYAWLNKAKMLGYANEVLQAADKRADEAQVSGRARKMFQG